MGSSGAEISILPELWSTAWGAMMGVASLRRMRIGCSFVPSTEMHNWYGVVEDPRRTTVIQFELSFGLEKVRTEHNLRGLKTAWTSKRTLITHRSGFADVFVPVVSGEDVLGMLVCGPILDRRPTSESLRNDWADMAGATFDADDPNYLRFVRCVLDSHLFEADAFRRLTKHIENLANVMAWGARPERLDMKGWLGLRNSVPEAGMWDLAWELVDSESNPRWLASYRDTDRSFEGIERMPNYVIGVAPFWRDATELEAAELMLRTHEFQRACAVVALDLPNTISGRIGAEAAFFLTHIEESKERARVRLRSFGERIRRLLGRKFATEVVCGFSERAMHGGELPARYDEALGAVFWGLHKNRALTFYSEVRPQDAPSDAGLYRGLRVLYEGFGRGQRRETGMAVQRVIKDVLWISGGNLEGMRSHFLEMLWELLALTERRELIDARTSEEMQATFAARLRKARATHEITNTFADLVRELLDLLDRPGKLSLRAKLERARRLVEKSLLERSGASVSFDLETVATQVGMSRSNFARHFQATYGLSFSDFAMQSRIERSKQLLRSTNLRVVEVSAEAGWSSASYFHQAFKRHTGVTPEQYKLKES